MKSTLPDEIVQSAVEQTTGPGAPLDPVVSESLGKRRQDALRRRRGVETSPLDPNSPAVHPPIAVELLADIVAVKVTERIVMDHILPLLAQMRRQYDEALADVVLQSRRREDA